MIGKVISINENTVDIQLSISDNEQADIVNKHIVLESEKTTLVAEAISLNSGIMKALIVGEFVNNQFVPGAIKKPPISSQARLITPTELNMLIGTENDKINEYFQLGESLVYDNFPVNIKINDFFSGHFAIFGNTGSGKSCSVSRIVQNIFYKSNPVAYKSNVLIFDVYGEYNTAFKDIHLKNPNIHSKIYTTNLNQDDTEIINIPFWLLGLDDIALLLNANDSIQLPILQKALKLVQIFGRDDEQAIKYKNNIIAKALQQILYSGGMPSQIRDQILAVLATFNTEELNSESKIVQPGYVRTLKQCLIIDSSGKINEMQLVSDFIRGFIDDNLDLDSMGNAHYYSMEQFKEALDFALISEGILKSDSVYDKTNQLKVRLETLINSENKKFFEGKKPINKEEYIKKLLTTDDGKKAQIIDFNMNYIDDRLAKVIVKIFSKMVFDFCTRLKNRASFPFHIVVEEAHRYIQNDTDVNLLGYNIFERIAKEGRKYGVILGLISQRPSELSETTLSQCNNFLIFRMMHPKDLSYVEQMVPNITTEITKKLKTLQCGTCIGFGSSFRIPIMIKFALPDPMPQSTNCDILNTWYIKL